MSLTFQRSVTLIYVGDIVKKITNVLDQIISHVFIVSFIERHLYFTNYRPSSRVKT